MVEIPYSQITRDALLKIEECEIELDCDYGVVRILKA